MVTINKDYLFVRHYGTLFSLHFMLTWTYTHIYIRETGQDTKDYEEL